MISLITADTGIRPITLAQIETAATELELESAALEKQIAKLDADLAEVKNRHIASLKRQAGVVAKREADLHSLIESAPELFIKPQTMVISGIKVGYANTPGAISFDDENQVVERIRESLKKRFDELVKTEYSVRKNALKILEPGDLRTIGCRVEGKGKTVVISRMAGEVEKLITKLITKLTEAIVTGE